MKKIKNVDNKFLGCVLKYAIGDFVHDPIPTSNINYTPKKLTKEEIEYITPIINEKQRQSIEFLNAWRESPIGREILIKSTGSEDQANKLSELRRKNLEEIAPPVLLPNDEIRYGSYPVSGINYPGTKYKSQTFIRPYGAFRTDLSHLFDHETTHGESRSGYLGIAGGLTPDSEKELINRFANKKTEDTNYYKSGGRKKDYKKYVTHPDETRARIMQIRGDEYRRKDKIFDPLTEKVTPQILEKMKNRVYSSKEKDPLKQLQDFYTDDEIIELFNSISQSKTDTIPIAQEGMFINNPNQYAPQQGVGGMYGASINGAPLPAVSNKFVNEQNKMIEYQNKLKRQDIAAAEQKLKPITNVLNVAAAVPVVGAPASAVLAGMDFAKGDTTSGIINTTGAVVGGALKGIAGVGKGVTNTINASDKALDAYSKYSAYNLITGPSGGSSNYINQVSSTPIDSIKSNVQNPKMFSSNPLSPKKAIKVPTVNAKMELGGFTEGDEVELSKSDYKRLIKMGYEIEEI